jgi:predicted RNase H-like nuclease (RuvC/YqgF family)
MGGSRAKFVLVILAIALLGCLGYAVSMNQEKTRIEGAYDEAQKALSELEQERAGLIQELAGSQIELNDLGGIREEVQRWRDELSQTQTKLERTQAELASLQVEYTQLRNTNATLVSQLDGVTDEKHALEAKFSNIDELKGAIRQIKREMWASRLQGWKDHVRVVKEEDARRLEEGNRGYVVRSGTSTLGGNPASITPRVQVRVLDPQTVSE